MGGNIWVLHSQRITCQELKMSLWWESTPKTLLNWYYNPSIISNIVMNCQKTWLCYCGSIDNLLYMWLTYPWVTRFWRKLLEIQNFEWPLNQEVFYIFHWESTSVKYYSPTFQLGGIYTLSYKSKSMHPYQRWHLECGRSWRDQFSSNTNIKN